MDKKQTPIRIPAALDFADLGLAREPNGDVRFNIAAIEQVCEESGLPAALFLQGPEDNLAGLIVTWYHAHRAAGGQTDPVAEQLIAETAAEDAAGQRYSLKGGQA